MWQINVLYNVFYYSTITPSDFNIFGHGNAQNIPQYYTVEQGKNLDRKWKNEEALLNHANFSSTPVAPNKKTTQLTKQMCIL